VNQDVLDRALQDILAAERSLRSLAEEQNRALRSVLTEVAYRLAGSALEALRRDDPGAPGSWTPEAWQSFFARELRAAGSGWSQPQELGERLRRVEASLREAEADRGQLAQRLSQALAELERLRAGTDGRIPAHSPAAPTPHLDGLRWPEIPLRPPARFAAKLGSGPRWRREAMALYLMATRGWSARLEILEALGRREKISPRSGSLKRIFEDGLIEGGFVESAVLAMNLSQGQTRLSAVRLKEAGGELCQALGWEPVEGEWERLMRLHDARTQEAHTAAVLAFAYHARRRGWTAEVMPEVEDARARPDARVEKEGEQACVEVELGEDKPGKWRNLAQLQGFVALCAATAEKRARLVGECMQEGLQGKATDIETLIQSSGAIPGQLWAEAW